MLAHPWFTGLRLRHWLLFTVSVRYEFSDRNRVLHHLWLVYRDWLPLCNLKLPILFRLHQLWLGFAQVLSWQVLIIETVVKFTETASKVDMVREATETINGEFEFRESFSWKCIMLDLYLVSTLEGERIMYWALPLIFVLSYLYRYPTVLVYKAVVLDFWGKDPGVKPLYIYRANAEVDYGFRNTITYVSRYRRDGKLSHVGLAPDLLYKDNVDTFGWIRTRRGLFLGSWPLDVACELILKDQWHSYDASACLLT